MDIPKTRWAKTIDGAYIAYQDFGEGPVTLVVIHGWVSHLEVDWEQPRYARFMRRLASNMRILNFDKRGTGMSDRFAQPPDLEVRMDDVRAVMDAAGVGRAALLGWGTGGPPPLEREERSLLGDARQHGRADAHVVRDRCPGHPADDPRADARAPQDLGGIVG